MDLHGYLHAPLATVTPSRAAGPFTVPAPATFTRPSRPSRRPTFTFPHTPIGVGTRIGAGDSASGEVGSCTSCGARAGSCDVRRWLSGRPCCDDCIHPRTDHGGQIQKLQTLTQKSCPYPRSAAVGPSEPTPLGPPAASAGSWAPSVGEAGLRLLRPGPWGRCFAVQTPEFSGTGRAAPQKPALLRQCEKPSPTVRAEGALGDGSPGGSS